MRLIDSVLPRAFHWWTDWYAANPEWFAGGIVVIVFFTLIGSALSAKISKFDAHCMAVQRHNGPTPAQLHAFCDLSPFATIEAGLSMGHADPCVCTVLPFMLVRVNHSGSCCSLAAM